MTGGMPAVSLQPAASTIEPMPASYFMVAGGGLAATVAGAVVLGTAVEEALGLTLVAGAVALGAGGIGALVLYCQRRRTIATQTMIVTLTSVGAIAAGALAAGQQMLVSRHGMGALAVVLMSAGTAGALISLALGRRVGADRSLSDAARRTGRGHLVTPVESLPTEEHG